MLKQILLVKQAQKGDHEAFIQLIQGYEEILYKMAFRFLRTEEDVADALQDTILIAFQKINQVKNPRYFNTWICKILINNCQKTLKKQQYFVDVTEEKSDLFFEELLTHLDERYSIPLTLHYYHGFSVKEISDLLDEPIGTIKSRLSRGRKKLKEQEDIKGGYFHYE